MVKLPLFVIVWFLLPIAGCVDRGFQFRGTYEAKASGYRIELLSRGYVRLGEDNANEAASWVQICPLPKVKAQPTQFRLIMPPNFAGTVLTISNQQHQWDWRTEAALLRGILTQAGYRNPKVNELNDSVRAIGSSLAGPKGALMQGQGGSLPVIQADLTYGYNLPRDRPSAEWVNPTELPPCNSTLESSVKPHE